MRIYCTRTGIWTLAGEWWIENRNYQCFWASLEQLNNSTTRDVVHARQCSLAHNDEHFE